MKHLFKKSKQLLVLFLFVAIAASCGSDDDDAAGLPGVPSGEIVAVELRQQTLTGFSAKGANSQKWWRHVVSSYSFSGECGGEEGDRESFDASYAFYPNGSIYVRGGTNGTPELGGTWSWTDANKNSINVSATTGESIVYQVTYLNDSNVVYAAVQTQGSCSLIEYNQLGSPFTD